MNEAPGARRVPVAVGAAAFALVATLLVVRTVSNGNVPGDPHASWVGMQDFRDAIYYPAVSFLAGGNPYDVPRHLASYPVSCKFPLYAPHTLVLHLPFALLAHAHAQLLHLALNVAMMVPLAWIALRAAGLTTPAAGVLLLATALLASRPGEMAVYVGQAAPYLAAGVFAALHLARTRPWLAGAGLALALTKPTFGLPVGLLMLCRGDIRAVLAGGALAAAASAVALPVLVHAAGGLAPFIGTLHDNYARWGSNQFTSVAASVHRVDAYLLAGRLAGRTLTTAEDAALMVAIFAFAAWVVWRLERTHRERSDAMSAAVICVATLAGTYHQTYDALLLALPALVLLSLRPLPASGIAPWARWLVAALIAVPALNYLASYGAIRLLGIEGAAWLVVTTANAAAVLACFVTLSVIALRMAARPVAHGDEGAARRHDQPTPARA